MVGCSKDPFCYDKLCLLCDESFTPKSRAQIYCAKCIPVARKIAQKEYRERNKDHNKKYYKEYKRKSREITPLHTIFLNRKSRANILGIPFSIEEKDLYIPECCPILKTPFKFKTPYTMSMDKIDPKLGYVKGNVQIISQKANTMKQDASRDELLKFADWVYAHFK